jgi:hypothetical protein
MDSTVRESSTRKPQCRHYRSTYATCFQHTPTTPKHLRTMDRLACTSHVSIPLRVSVWDSASQAASSLQQDDQLSMGARRRCLQRAVSQPQSHRPAKAQSVEGIERGGEGREVGDSSLPLSTYRYHLQRVHRGEHDYPDDLSHAKQSVRASTKGHPVHRVRAVAVAGTRHRYRCAIWPTVEDEQRCQTATGSCTCNYSA